MAPKREVRSLTGLRGFAAVAVMFHHANLWSIPKTLFTGQIWVDVFFVLSGFVMAYVYAPDGEADFPWRRFIISRVTRIYPLHLLTATGMVLLFFFINHFQLPEWATGRNAIKEALLVTAMPGMVSDHIWNGNSWSISVEWWAYFIAIPVLMILARFEDRKVFWILTALYAALAVWLYTGADAAVYRGWPAFLRALMGFSVGWYTCLAGAKAHFEVKRWVFATYAVTALLIAYIFPILWGADAWLLLPTLPFLIYGLWTSDDSRPTLLSDKAFHYLGKISFSLYLCHPLVEPLVRWLLEDRLGYSGLLGWVLLVPILSLPVAIISHFLIERHLAQWLRGKLEKPRPAVA